MKRALLIALALLLAAGFAALGIWQVERRAWKLDLIARVETGIHSPPAPIPAAGDWPAFDAHGNEYRRVRTEGVLLDDRDTLVKALTERGAGFWLLTPLRTAQGVVLVNRGFVPDAATAHAARLCGPTRNVAVTGLIRASEPGGGFLRSNDPAADRWFSRDVAAIGAARRLGRIAPFFIDADASPNPGGYPVGGLTVIRFNNNHLVYALTWFGLTGMSAAAAWMAFRGGRVR